MTRTLYAQLANKLAEDITTGYYPVGTLLPTEQELCEKFGASRCTVRSAIKQLKDIGMLASRKKVGTRVVSNSTTGSYRQSLATVDDLLQFNAAHIRLVRNIDNFVADCNFSKEMGCQPGTRWLHITGSRARNTAERKPVAWSEVFIDPDYSDIAKTVRESPEALVSQLIEKRYGRRIAEIRQEIQAVLTTPEVAGELQIKAGAPAFRILRRYYDQNGELFEMSITIHPAEQFTFSIKLTRDLE